MLNLAVFGDPAAVGATSDGLVFVLLRTQHSYTAAVNLMQVLQLMQALNQLVSKSVRFNK